LAPRFPDGEALSQTSVSFNSSFFKSWSKFRDLGR
jgi:hypothetical protein